MTSKKRLLSAINREKPDCLPVTTHHVMPYFLDKYMNGMTIQEFFEYFGLDQILWTNPRKPQDDGKSYFEKPALKRNFSETRKIVSDSWKIKSEKIAEQHYTTFRYNIITPKKTLSMMLQSNKQTSWIVENLIKEKSDINIIAEFATNPTCDVAAVNEAAEEFAERGLVRGHICCFDVYGQPGCWQDACCLVGTEKLILEAYDDPQWVHELLKILQRRKLIFIESLKDAKYDIIELGGGDASTTVISPQIFNEFVAPYDSVLIKKAREVGQRIVYHTCGGMMPILEDIAAIKPDAMETFTPATMGGDVNLAEAKKIIGEKVCMIGGFDQFHYFNRCTPDETRAAVRRCFEQAGEGGGYILCPSDHFFDADPNLIKAYVDEARECYL